MERALLAVKGIPAVVDRHMQQLAVVDGGVRRATPLAAA